MILTAESWFSDHKIKKWKADFLLYVGVGTHNCDPNYLGIKKSKEHQNINDSNCWIIDLGSKARMEKLFGSKLEENPLALPTSLASRLKVK